MAEIATPAAKPNPWKNPSYPQRVHARERAQWLAVLKTWDDRIAQAGRSLGTNGADPARARLFAQMLGARDQIAEAAARMPGEVGELYAEDHHRLDQAVQALERLFARWDGQTA